MLASELHCVARLTCTLTLFRYARSELSYVAWGARKGLTSRASAAAGLESYRTKNMFSGQQVGVGFVSGEFPGSVMIIMYPSLLKIF